MFASSHYPVIIPLYLSVNWEVKATFGTMKKWKTTISNFFLGGGAKECPGIKDIMCASNKSQHYCLPLPLSQSSPWGQSG